MAAKEQKLGKLHELLTDHFIKALKSLDAGKELNLEDTIMVGLSPALLGVMAKFLKDNEITCQVGDEGSDIAKLRDQLNGRRTVGNVTHI